MLEFLNHFNIQHEFILMCTIELLVHIMVLL